MGGRKYGHPRLKAFSITKFNLMLAWLKRIQVNYRYLFNAILETNFVKFIKITCHIICYIFF